MGLRRSLLFLGFFLAAPIGAVSGNVVADYAFAQKCYHRLDKSSAAGWDRCIQQFEKLVLKYPKTSHAKKALFSVARLSQEKHQIAQEASDLAKALKIYNYFLRTYPKDSMADDVLYRIAKLRFEKEDDKIKAKRALETLLERYPNGDMAERALIYLERMRDSQAVITVQDIKEEEPKPKVKKPVISVSSPPKPALKMEKGKRDKVLIRTIVIDPGHGGDDVGAKGRGGTKESVVDLQVARKVAFRLRKQLGIETYLTRTNNKMVSLDERNVFANQKEADLFISIHANGSSIREASGVQTFYLNNASDEAASRLAAQENKHSGKKMALSDKILTTMLQNANTEESRDLARSVQSSLVDRLRKDYTQVKNLKVGTALFYVLVGTKCPSILVEISFITNPKEEAHLKDSAYQWAIADGLSQGIKKYIEKRQKIATSSL